MNFGKRGGKSTSVCLKLASGVRVSVCSTICLFLFFTSDFGSTYDSKFRYECDHGCNPETKRNLIPTKNS